MDDDDLELLSAEDIIAFVTVTNSIYVNSYPLINKFDGKVCDFGFPEGGGWMTSIPFSKRKGKGAATLTIMKDWVEFDITDDWGAHHYLYIRKTESDVIFKAILSYKEVYNIVPVLK